MRFLFFRSCFSWQRLCSRDDTPSEIKQIMVKANKSGGTGLYPRVVVELRADDTNWEQVQKDTKEIARLGTSSANSPLRKATRIPRQKLTKAYADNARASTLPPARSTRTPPSPPRPSSAIAAKPAIKPIGNSNLRSALCSMALPSFAC